MKILFISDIVVDHIYSSSIKDRLKDIDLVISCGDLPCYYLEFIVSTLNKPLYYVLGNHDGKKLYTEQGIKSPFPEGCINIDGKIMDHEGIIIAGLEGSMRYSGGPMQYSERQMCSKILSLKPRLYMNKLIKKRYVDLLITHAPPYEINDAKDLCHKGFICFKDFIKKYSPKYMVHGHMHLYGPSMQRESTFLNTKVINAYGYFIMEL